MSENVTILGSPISHILFLNQSVLCIDPFLCQCLTSPRPKHLFCAGSCCIDMRLFQNMISKYDLENHILLLIQRKRFATANIFKSVTILSVRLSAFALTGYQDSKLPVMTHDDTIDTAVSVNCTCASTHLQISIQLSCLVGLRQHFF